MGPAGFHSSAPERLPVKLQRQVLPWLEDCVARAFDAKLSRKDELERNGKSELFSQEFAISCKRFRAFIILFLR